MATYAIGDVQGCHDPLRRLLDKLQLGSTAELIRYAVDHGLAAGL